MNVKYFENCNVPYKCSLVSCRLLNHTGLYEVSYSFLKSLDKVEGSVSGSFP